MSDIPTRADVVVIGGGPAGSLCSGYLSQAGFDVCLLEKVRHPRNTVGESLLPHFWRFTDALEGASERIEAADFVRKAGGIVQWGGNLRRTKFQDFGHRRPSLHIDRDIFDQLLLDTSRDHGTRVFEETQAIRVDLDDPDRKVVHYRTVEGGERGEIAAPHVVDASGQAAVIAKQLGVRVFDDQLRFVATWGYFEDSDFLDYEGCQRPFEERYDHAPVTTVSSVAGGWCWHIPLKRWTSVGVILPTARMKEGEGSLEERFLRRVGEVPVTNRLLRNATFVPGSVRGIRDYAYRPVSLVAGGCYLIGDAAAFVDPINSAGVTFSMYAAYSAAEAIKRALHRPDRRDTVAEIFERQYRARLQVFRLVALPAEAEVSDEELEEMTRALRWFSEPEIQLALTTSILTERPSRVQACLDNLGIEAAPVWTPVALAAPTAG